MSEIKISKIASKINYVPLETKENCYLISIKKVIFIGNRIAVLDSSRKKIIIFTLDGKFIKSIESVGKGPHEYIKIGDIYCYNGQLALYDKIQRKVLIYDDEFNFQQQFVLKDQLIKLHHYNNMFVGYNHPPNNWTTDSYRVVIFDDSMNELGRFHKAAIGSHSADPVSVTSYMQYDTLVVWNSRSTKVYQYNGKEESIRYNLIYDNNLSPEVRNRIVMNGSDNSNLVLIDLIETQDMLFLEFVRNKHIVFAYFDKATNSISYNNSNSFNNGFSDDYYNVCKFWPQGKISNKIVWSQIDNAELLDILKYNKNYDPSPKFLQLMDATDLSSNPILIIINLI